VGCKEQSPQGRALECSCRLATGENIVERLQEALTSLPTFDTEGARQLIASVDSLELSKWHSAIFHAKDALRDVMLAVTEGRIAELQTMLESTQLGDLAQASVGKLSEAQSELVRNLCLANDLREQLQHGFHQTQMSTLHQQVCELQQELELRPAPAESQQQLDPSGTSKVAALEEKCRELEEEKSKEARLRHELEQEVKALKQQLDTNKEVEAQTAQ